METAELLSLVDHLEDNIDDLEESLEPLLAAALSATTKKLPVLDKAKLYVLIVYSIESLLFSYLRLHGVQAKEHPVFKELTRVKQYFEKIKVAEASPAQSRQNLSLNRQAAGRVIKHALAGNNKYDLERAEREAREKLLAKRKLTKFIDNKMPHEQPQDVGEARKDIKAQEDSDLKSRSRDDDLADADLTGASVPVTKMTTDVRMALVDAPDESVGQSGRLSRKEKCGDKTKREKRQAFTAAMQTPDWQAHTRGKSRKKKFRRKQRKAPQKEEPVNSRSNGLQAASSAE